MKERTIRVFGSGKKNSILVPENPIIARNNCRIGKWIVHRRQYGGRNQIAVLKFSRFFGNFGRTKDTLWGQVWFVCEKGDLPKGIVMVTYLKKRSLLSFGEIISMVRRHKANPAVGTFTPIFIERTRAPKGDAYYALEWEWEERAEKERERALQELASAIEGGGELMVEPIWTKEMVCLDGLTVQESHSVVSEYIRRGGRGT